MAELADPNRTGQHEKLLEINPNTVSMEDMYWPGEEVSPAAGAPTGTYLTSLLGHDPEIPLILPIRSLYSYRRFPQEEAEQEARTVPDVRIFLSFDRTHDLDLYERFVTDSHLPASGFEIVDHSEARTGEAELRRRMESADHLIVLCGEHTDECERVAREMLFARDAELPCLMLWGRRELMCKRPMDSRRDDTMYTWNSGVVREQLAAARRSSATREAIVPRVTRP